MKILPVFIIAALAFCACTSKKPTDSNTVHLRGQLIDMGSQEVRMSYNGASSALGDSRTILLTTDAQGNFDTTLVLTEPAYFNISRNTLYLSPGDELTVKITTDNTEAQFSGIGAQVNTYMKERLFPKAGSFLQAGENITGDFAQTKQTIDSLAAIRQHRLDTLSNASPLFKKLEKARIQADVANSYIYYLSYAEYAKSSRNLPIELPDRETFRAMLTPHLQPILKEIADPAFLDVAVVRDVFSYSADSTLRATWFAGIELPQRTQELFSSVQQVQKLAGDVSPETIDEVSAFVQTLKNKDFADEINLKIAQAGKLFPGKPAIDFQIEDVEGKISRLSDFKGKLLYIDLWATWCGPCIQESPIFEALAQKFDSNDILFIPISTDNAQKEWLNYLNAHNDKKLKQYHSVDKALQEGWNMKSIPRFILIDKNFNIVNAYAPRPSEPEVEKLLHSLISGN